jgi:hypothetical protein
MKGAANSSASQFLAAKGEMVQRVVKWFLKTNKDEHS